MTPSDLLTIVVACISSSICLVGLAGLIMINILNFKNKSRQSERTVQIARKMAENANRPLPVKTRILLAVYLLVFLLGLGSIVFGILVVVSDEINLPLLEDVNSIGLVGSLLLLVAIIVTLMLIILYRNIFKPD